MGLKGSCEPSETPDVSGNSSATDPAEITPAPPGLETRSDIVQPAAIGIHVHQGDFDPFNLWLNTLFAVSLIWLSATGIVSWWTRRPKGRIGVRPRATVGRHDHRGRCDGRAAADLRIVGCRHRCGA
jgi:PepSY-associated TM region